LHRFDSVAAAATARKTITLVLGIILIAVSQARQIQPSRCR